LILSGFINLAPFVPTRSEEIQVDVLTAATRSGKHVHRRWHFAPYLHSDLVQTMLKLIQRLVDVRSLNSGTVDQAAGMNCQLKAPRVYWMHVTVWSFNQNS
jgi:hypothetical protein